MVGSFSLLKGTVAELKNDVVKVTALHNFRRYAVISTSLALCDVLPSLLQFLYSERVRANVEIGMFLEDFKVIRSTYGRLAEKVFKMKLPPSNALLGTATLDKTVCRLLTPGDIVNNVSASLAYF